MMTSSTLFQLLLEFSEKHLGRPLSVEEQEKLKDFLHQIHSPQNTQRVDLRHKREIYRQEIRRNDHEALRQLRAQINRDLRKLWKKSGYSIEPDEAATPVKNTPPDVQDPATPSE
jgi:hypothetical protein